MVTPRIGAPRRAIRLARLALHWLAAAGIEAQVLPEPTRENVFYITPLWEGPNTDAETRREMDRLIAQFGRGNLYNQIGFGGISSTPARFAAAKEKRLRMLPIFATAQTHHVAKPIKDYLATDLRAIQWRMDGVTWKGAPKNAGGPALETNPDPRDLRVPTPSRYCTGLRAAFFARLETTLADLLSSYRAYPREMVAVNGVIEEELAIGGAANDAYLGDWSPYAITEFRDWLRHTGRYDADTGAYAGQGAREGVTGPHLIIKGKPRSAFYDDPTPAQSQGTGPAFNQAFGTAFRAWTLRYWDLSAFPAPITDTTFDPSPDAGPGFTAGGFDAPRSVAPADPFWKAWSWDYEDQGKTYPPGSAREPAYGFRQQMVKNWIRDVFDFAAARGFPREMLYAHQIPGEMVSRFTGGSSRGRSSASPTWTGYLEASGTVGVTRFGRLDIPAVTRLSGRWGIFEWHPAPNAQPQSQRLYDAALADLRDYKAAGARILCPGWWKAGPPDSTFPLNDSRFAEAIRDFLAAQPERPRGDTVSDPAAYVPPAVRAWEIRNAGAAGYRLNFSPYIWKDQDFRWTDWSQFRGHGIETSPDSLSWTAADLAGDTALYQPKSGEAFRYFRARAISKAGKGGEWSVYNLCVDAARAAAAGKACGPVGIAGKAAARPGANRNGDGFIPGSGHPMIFRWRTNAFDANGALQ